MSSKTAFQLSDLVQSMNESSTLRMAQLSRDLTAQGHHVINLSIGEPDFTTPKHICEAAKKALDEGYTKYTPVPGLPELRQAIVEKFKKDNNLHYTPNQIVVSNGAKQSIANLALALLNPGDEAIIFSPYWVSYYEIIKMTGAIPVPVYAGVEQDYKVQPHQLEAAITDKTRFVLFSSPCNPTGSVYTRDELEALAEVVARHEGVYIISDEIYEYIIFTDQHVSIGSLPSVKDRTITVNGFAKGFAMTGWRLGYMGAPTVVAEACTKIQGQFTSGASAFGQKAAVIALQADLGPTRQMCEAFRHRRDICYELLSKIDGMKVNYPQGAFYFFPDISAFFGKTDGETIINSSDDFCEYLLHKAHVGTVAGTGFGAPDCFRLSYAASEKELREAIDRIGNALAKLH